MVVCTALPLPSTNMGLVTCCAASPAGAAALLAVIARTAPAVTHELAQSGSARPRFVAWSRRSRLQCRCAGLDERSAAMSAVLGAYEAAQYHVNVLMRDSITLIRSKAH